MNYFTEGLGMGMYGRYYEWIEVLIDSGMKIPLLKTTDFKELEIERFRLNSNRD